jgi:Fe2+ or Zn2+ uptake regulation protein
MTKQEVLEILSRTSGFIPPDEVCRQLRGFHHRSSVYSYLLRLHKQGLLHREIINGRIAYQISQHGIERLHFFRRKQGFTVPAMQHHCVLPIGENERK